MLIISFFKVSATYRYRLLEPRRTILNSVLLTYFISSQCIYAISTMSSFILSYFHDAYSINTLFSLPFPSFFSSLSLSLFIFAYLLYLCFIFFQSPIYMFCYIYSYFVNLSCASLGLVLIPPMCLSFVGLPFFPLASWPLSFPLFFSSSSELV